MNGLNIDLLEGLKLNLGCGECKMPGWINIDIEDSVEPDLKCDFRNGLPYEDDSVSAILMSHVIEHIEKKYWGDMFLHIHRVLKPNAYLMIAYPEFVTCAKNYVTNFQGKRDLWEATIFGRQLYPADYHVSLMDTPVFAKQLMEMGFKNVVSHPQPVETYNTIIVCQKNPRTFGDREEILRKEVFGLAQ